MKVYFAVLILFLAAFAGLAAGLLLKRKGLRGSCGPAVGSGRNCECTAEPAIGRSAETPPHIHADGGQACEDCPAVSSQQHDPQHPSSSSPL